MSAWWETDSTSAQPAAPTALVRGYSSASRSTAASGVLKSVINTALGTPSVPASAKPDPAAASARVVEPSGPSSAGRRAVGDATSILDSAHRGGSTATISSPGSPTISRTTVASESSTHSSWWTTLTTASKTSTSSGTSSSRRMNGMKARIARRAARRAAPPSPDAAPQHSLTHTHTHTEASSAVDAHAAARAALLPISSSTIAPTVRIPAPAAIEDEDDDALPALDVHEAMEGKLRRVSSMGARLSDAAPWRKGRSSIMLPSTVSAVAPSAPVLRARPSLLEVLGEDEALGEGDDREEEESAERHDGDEIGVVDSDVAALTGAMGSFGVSAVPARLRVDERARVRVCEDGTGLLDVLKFCTAAELTSTLPRVNRAFRASSQTAASWRIATTIGAPARELTLTHTNFLSFAKAFPYGTFLAEGGYKQVFRVWNDVLRRFEAVSVLDIQALRESDSVEIVQAEVLVSCLAAELVHAGVCPNFVDVHQVFLARMHPSHHFAEHWGAAEHEPSLGAHCPFTIDGMTVPQLLALASTNGKPEKPTRGRNGRGGSRGPLRSTSHSVVAATAEHFASLQRLQLAACDGEYLYTRMELCDGGDMEGCLRKLEPHIVELETASMRKPAIVAARPRSKSAASSLEQLSSRSGSKSGHTAVVDNSAAALDVIDRASCMFARNCFLQMCMSAYVSRERLQMRHNDIKLLNFFLSTALRVRGLQYVLGDDQFDIDLTFDDGAHDSPVRQLHGYVVKLADFGTVDTNAATLGQPITAFQFTTLENAPLEYFLQGDSCVQSYAADTWALGLCLLHLLTGAAPYEELMAVVRCPPLLRASLMSVWKRTKLRRVDDADAQAYNVIASLVRDYGEDVMVDTLYRLLVLVEFSVDDKRFACFAKTPVLGAVLTCYAGHAPAASDDGATGTVPRGTKASRLHQLRTSSSTTDAETAERLALQRLLTEHQQLFGLSKGEHPMWQRMRRRLAKWPGAHALLLQLLHPDPCARPTMLDVLRGPAFRAMRCDPSKAAPPAGILKFAAYASTVDLSSY